MARPAIYGVTNSDVRVAQQDRAQDSYKLGVAPGNGATDPLKVGERYGALRALPIPSQASVKAGEGVETGRAAPKGFSLGWRDSPDHKRPHGRRRKPKWYESWGRGFESRRGHHFLLENSLSGWAEGGRKPRFRLGWREDLGSAEAGEGGDSFSERRILSGPGDLAGLVLRSRG